MTLIVISVSLLLVSVGLLSFGTKKTKKTSCGCDNCSCNNPSITKN